MSHVQGAPTRKVCNVMGVSCKQRIKTNALYYFCKNVRGGPSNVAAIKIQTCVIVRQYTNFVECRVFKGMASGQGATYRRSGARFVYRSMRCTSTEKIMGVSHQILELLGFKVRRKVALTCCDLQLNVAFSRGPYPETVHLVGGFMQVSHKGS